MQLIHAGGRFDAAWVHSDDGDAELRAQPCRLSADASDANDYRRGDWEMDGLIAGAPLPLELVRDVEVEPSGEGQHKGHYVGADVVVEYLPHVGDHNVAVY